MTQAHRCDRSKEFSGFSRILQVWEISQKQHLH